MEINQIKMDMDNLAKQINYHNELYYQKATQEITDAEFDKLFNKLLEFEEKYPQFADPNSPTKKAGSDIDNQFDEIAHTIPVLSLDKEYSAEEIVNWTNKIQNKIDYPISFTMEPKIDGFSVVLYYKNGTLDLAVSRGNGEIGNDITDNVKTIKSIPKKISKNINMAVRGEVFIHKEKFKTYNEKMDNIYANPRNFAAGGIRRKKSKEVASIPLEIFVYDAFFENKFLTSNTEIIHFLIEEKFPINPKIAYFTSDISLFSNIDQISQYPMTDIENYIKNMTQERKNLSFEIDGLVLKVNEYQARETLGYTSHHPRWAIAYKFESPQNISIVENINIQIGRTGKITPLATIKPVQISGTTVTKASLHNQTYIDELELAIGDTVVVSKRGEIIPAIEKVIDKGPHNTYQIQNNCPDCNTELIHKGAHLFCPNKDCFSRIKENIIYFTGVLDIKNLGRKTVAFFLEHQIIKSILDLYSLDYNNLKTLEGFGSRKVDLIKNGLEESKKSDFKTLITSLGLEDIGPKVIDILLKNGLNSLDKILEKVSKKDPSLFSAFDGIGDSTALSILNHFSNEQTINQLKQLEKVGFALTQNTKPVTLESDFLKNTLWGITGSFEFFKPREKAFEIIELNGGKTSSSVTQKTTHFLVGEKPGSKLKKARDAGAKIVNEKEFLEIIKNRKL